MLSLAASKSEKRSELEPPPWLKSSSVKSIGEFAPAAADEDDDEDDEDEEDEEEPLRNESFSFLKIQRTSVSSHTRAVKRTSQRC